MCATERQANERQKKVAIELIKNIKNNPVVNASELLETVGYTRNTARHKQKTIIQSKGVQNELRPVLKKLIEKRELVIKALTGEKIEAEKAKDLVDMLDKLTKNIELLSGRPTENINNPYENQQLRKIADRIRGRNPDGQADGAE